MASKVAVAALALLISACGQQATKVPAKPEQTLEGYGDLKLGMTFDQATAATAAYSFDPGSLKQCLAQLAVRGCILNPQNDLTAYRTIEGVPYGLELAFNSHDRLTDIYLDYERNAYRDPAEQISKEDCLSIYDRTMDWVVKQYGKGFLEREEKPSPPNRTTPGGNRYFVNDVGGTVVGIQDKTMPKGRILTLMATYFGKGADSNCSVEVVFQEPRSVERWKLPPDQQDIVDRAAKEVESESAATQEDVETAPDERSEMDSQEGE
jgi:hypothetical protein